MTDFTDFITVMLGYLAVRWTVWNCIRIRRLVRSHPRRRRLKRARLRRLIFENRLHDQLRAGVAAFN